MSQETEEAWQLVQNSPGDHYDSWKDKQDPFVDENAHEKQVDGPSQPTYSFEPIPGYESVMAIDKVFDIPPPPYELPSEDSKPKECFKVADLMSEKVVRDALRTFVDRNRVYSSRPAKEMQINSIEPSSVLHYQLETFTEARYIKWAHCVYYSDDVDGPHCGRAPLPWEIDCHPSELFIDHQKEMEVPHTSNVRECFKCCGSGNVRCRRCRGKLVLSCGHCHGDGYLRVTTGNGQYTASSFRGCPVCHATGEETCAECSGRGDAKCQMCRGGGKLRHFIKLFVKFTNHQSEHITDGSNVPDDLIRGARGQVIFQQSQPHIWPVTQYTVQEVNDNSVRIVGEHQEAWPKERTLMQRQLLRSVPISEVAYTWKNVNTRFWVYGCELKVHAPDYPHKSCWGSCNVS